MIIFQMKLDRIFPEQKSTLIHFVFYVKNTRGIPKSIFALQQFAKLTELTKEGCSFSHLAWPCQCKLHMSRAILIILLWHNTKYAEFHLCDMIARYERVLEKTDFGRTFYRTAWLNFVSKPRSKLTRRDAYICYF